LPDYEYLVKFTRLLYENTVAQVSADWENLIREHGLWRFAEAKRCRKLLKKLGIITIQDDTTEVV